MKDLAKELSVAMTNHPNDSVVDIIKRAIELKYPSIKNVVWTTHVQPIDNWKPNNSDICKALRYYNKMNSF